ncbi:MAG: hypothetical protein HEP71_06760 [Roseivirga sp.]|nr:hypothetical protein [Roseivirga sp.]
MNKENRQSHHEEIKVGQWTISAELGIVSGPLGKSLVLEPRLSRLLYLLALQEGDIVSREHLISQIWQETIVNEESLTRAIADLRKTLSKNFETPPVIQTLRKRGYQLNLKNGPKAMVLKLKIKKKHLYPLLGVACTLILLLWWVV